MASNSHGNDAEHHLFGCHFTLRKVTRLNPLSHQLMHHTKTASTLHRVLMLAQFIGFFPKRLGFQHQLHTEIIRINLRKMATCKPNGMHSFAASSLEAKGWLKKISALFLSSRDDRQSDVFLGFEMQIQRPLGIFYGFS